MLGFTGSRNGMTCLQKESVTYLVRAIGMKEAHHGDCVGADEDFHNLVNKEGYTTVVHPPKNPKFRAFCDGNLIFPEKEYMDRNRDIVDLCEVIIATPNTFVEKSKGGTWSTVRYAVKMNKKLFIVLPNGKIVSYIDIKSNRNVKCQQ